MKTFTIGFDLSSVSGLELSFDERAKAEHISYLARTEHYEMVLKAGDMERCMEKYIRHLEEPRVGQSYPNYYAAKLASKFGKVVLSGCGGDELFAGYPWRYLYSTQGMNYDAFIDAYYAKWQRLLPNSCLQELLEPIWADVKHICTKSIFSDVFKNIRKDRLSGEDCVNSSLYLEAKTFLHGLLVVEDKLSMAHGLENRVPFLDNDLVDFALKIPNSLKLINENLQVNENDQKSKIAANKGGKLILRKTLNSYLDDTVVNDIKQGFSSPDASWFRGESIDYVTDQFKEVPQIFNRTVVDNILAEHVSGKRNNRLAIWSILYLTNMHRMGYLS